jgi:hypothetical protein
VRLFSGARERLLEKLSRPGDEESGWGQNTRAKRRAFQRVTYTQLSKDDIEAATKKSMIGSEEFTEARVGRISTHIARVEVVGCIEYSQRQSQAILLRHLKLFRYFGVE